MEGLFMPHCSLQFSHIGLRVAVHSRWNETQTQCQLHLFADHKHILAFLPELPDAEAQDFARMMMRCALPADVGEEGMYCIEGVPALSLTNFLVYMHRHVQEEVIRVAEAPDFMGIWEPLPWRARSQGMIMWFHPDEGYRAVIAYTKDQATDVIRRLSWLEPQRSESLQAGIRRWNAPRTSPHAVQEMRGVCAQVLCLASVAAKMRNATQIIQSALLN